MSEVISSRSNKEEVRVYFHPKQVEYLEKLFPERVLPHTASEAELREYMGTRLVIRTVRDLKRSE